jgi:hypothetical protein
MAGPRSLKPKRCTVTTRVGRDNTGEQPPPFRDGCISAAIQYDVTGSCTCSADEARATSGRRWLVFLDQLPHTERVVPVLDPNLHTRRRSCSTGTKMVKEYGGCMTDQLLGRRGRRTHHQRKHVITERRA